MINWIKVTDPKMTISIADADKDGYVYIRVGKKKIGRVRFLKEEKSA